MMMSLRRGFGVIFVLVLATFLSGFDGAAARGAKPPQQLKLSFYRKSCPRAEEIVKNVTESMVKSNPELAAKLIRLHYHDCFVRGCDASILLDPVTGAEQVEKQARPNLSLGGYEVIDEIKAQLEEECPGKVSCADILALSARDAVSLSFGRKLWKVETGRKDGVVSLASDVNGNLPSPFANFTTLQMNFQDKGLNVVDLVALSGAHTIGVSHCGAVSRRLFNFDGQGNPDPSLDPTYADFLRTLCPQNQTSPATTVEMDPADSTRFNNHYFQILRQNKGLFISDAALLTDRRSNFVVRRMMRSNWRFLAQFKLSVERMSRVEVLTGDAGQIRTNCRRVN